MLRLAVVDADSQAMAYQAAGRRSRRFQLVAVVGSSTGGEVTEWKDLEALLQHADSFDACVLHATADACLPAAKRLTALGKHILLDYPTCDLTTLDQLVDACGTSRLSMAQRQRFTPYAATIRASLLEGQLGRPGLVRIHRWAPQPKADGAGTELWKMLVQEVDLACWLLGNSPAQVFGQTADGDSLKGGCQAHLGFAGSMALVDCALIPGPSYYSVSVIGARGAAYADDHHNTNLVFKGQLRGNVLSPNDGWLLRQLDSFAESIQTEQDDQSVSDTRRAISVAHAAIQSAASHRVAAGEGEAYVLQ